MKFVPNAASRVVARQVLKTQKNSPKLLLVAGVAGAVGATVLACRATLKVEEVIEKTEADLEKIQKHEPADTKQKAVSRVYIHRSLEITKLYAPAVLLGGVSIAALIGSHNILSKRNAALTVAYAGLEKTFAGYRDRIREEFGEEKEREVYYAAEHTEVMVEGRNGPKKEQVKVAGANGASPYAKFFDEFSPSWSPVAAHNLIFLRAQQNMANDLLQARGHVFLNDVYDMLGIERTSAGSVVGWVISKNGGDNFIDFGIFDGNKENVRDFVNGRDAVVLLDFNVDGVIYDKI